ncbi:hybrid sensor histidine kinase/response regulator [Reinekea sp. G2M2-21]|uniref:PAS domain-containing hybrid sensor histidine kinase/response regulator n=1 Tax=Reinekea sp. G2M2-21 TaxID=2788942 RepID=UPI0018AB8162|nr:hybrid sensor histidine kinase/response regulator [Reinekea sp. G2M2-21]
MPIFNRSTFDQLLRPNSKTLAFVWLNKPGWPIVECSTSAANRLGLSLDALQQQKILYQSLIHPDDIAHVESVVFAAFKGQFEENNESMRYRVKGPDDTWIWVESDSTQMSIPGEDTQILGFVRDISEHYETEVALQKNQDRLELVLDGARMGMWDWNPQTNEVSCDERWANQIGLTLKTLNFHLSDWSSRVHPDDLAPCLTAIQKHLDGETETYENVHRMRHSKGYWVYILDRGKVFERDEKGRAIKFVGTHTDISHIKATELKAIEALNARDRFFSSMSHELRTPLHAILGTAELLEQELTNPEDQQKMSLVRENSEYLLNVLKDILDVAKMKAGELHLELSQFDVRVVMLQVERLFSARARQKGLTISVHIEKGLATEIESDRNRLIQILVNLLSNAVRYTAEGSITLTLDEENGDLRLGVLDTGRGIQNTATVFLPFKQESQRQIDDVHTTGLGLTIVQSLVDQLGMRVEVESEINRGSQFYICIPASARRARSLVNPSAVSGLQIDKLSESLAQLTILVVDDNDVNRALARAMLKKANATVVEARDGEEAVKLVKQQTFDVICLDLHMPNMGGIKATRRIRHLLIDQQPKIIGMSADAYPETIAHCLRAGMDDYITKPFKQQQLLDVLVRVMQQGS